MSRMKVSLAIDPADILPVSAVLVDFGELQLESPKEHGQTDWHQVAERLADQDRRIRALMEKLSISEEESKQMRTDVDPEETAQEADALLEQLGDQAAQLESEAEAIEKRINRLRTFAENRRLLEAAGIDFERIHRLRLLHLEIGSIPADDQGRVTLPVIRTPVVIIPLHATRRKRFVAAATLKNNAFVLKRVLGSLFFEPLEGLQSTEDGSNDPEQHLKTIENRHSQIENDRFRMASDWGGRLKKLRVKVQRALEVVRFIDRYGRSGDMVVFSGEIAEGSVDRLLNAIKETAQRPYTALAGKSREVA